MHRKLDTRRAPSSFDLSALQTAVFVRAFSLVKLTDAPMQTRGRTLMPGLLAIRIP